MDNFLRDVRYGVRMLVRSRSVTLIAIFTLALGIGVNSAIFSLVNAVLLRPLPVSDPDRVTTIVLNSARLNATGAQPGYSAYGTWRKAASFESVCAAAPGSAVIEIESQQRPAKFWRVTDTFFPTLGVNPTLGRTFTAQEDQPGGPKVAVLSQSLWRNSFNADPRVLGTTVRIEKDAYTIIGVLPHGFHVDGRPADIYTPIQMSTNSREWLSVNMYARLKPGVTVEQATSELQASRAGDDSPGRFKAQVWKLRDFQVRDVRTSLWVLLAAVGLVLLIACANIASLLLARAQARRQEVAVRAALGAGQSRLLRQLLTESTLLALVGGVAGVGVAAVCIRLLPGLLHERLPGLLEQTRLDGAVLLFTLALSIFTGLLFGVVPALAMSRRDPFEAIKAGRRGGEARQHQRSLRALVIAETALALILAVGASLLIRTFFYLRDVAPGFKVDGLLIAQVNSDRTRFASGQQFLSHYSGVIETTRRMPGVKSASFAQTLPLTGDNAVMQWPIEGHQFANPREMPILWQRTVDTEYFKTMQIPLRRGRLFDERDNMTAPKVALVNESFVRRFWPNENPIGKHIGGYKDQVPLFEVVGVVGDVRNQDSTKDAANEIYLHYQQMPTARVSLVIRTDPNVYRRPTSAEPALRSAIASVDSKQAVTKVAEIQQVISDRIAPKRLSAQLIAIFAGLATMLALVGTYGVLSFSVAQRTHEIGVRVALGANAPALVRMVALQAVALAGAGVLIGAAASFGLTRLIASLLYGVRSTDPATYVAAAAGALVMSVLASAVPAWRAARVDPLVALREE